MEQVPIFEERETTYVTRKEEPVEAFWDPEKREYHILVENETDWSVEKEEVEETFRAVTGQNHHFCKWKRRFLIISIWVFHGSSCGCRSRTGRNRSWKFCKICSSGISWSEPDSSGWWNRKKNRFRFWNGAIRQPVCITKHISQSSYENVNTYGSVHNDPVTTFLGLFRKMICRRPETFRSVFIQDLPEAKSFKHLCG